MNVHALAQRPTSHPASSVLTHTQLIVLGNVRSLVNCERLSWGCSRKWWGGGKWEKRFSYWSWVTCRSSRAEWNYFEPSISYRLFGALIVYFENPFDFFFLTGFYNLLMAGIKFNSVKSRLILRHIHKHIKNKAQNKIASHNNNNKQVKYWKRAQLRSVYIYLALIFEPRINCA